MTFGAVISGGVWLRTTKFDPAVVGMYLRHYSASKNVGDGYHERASRYRHGVGGSGESVTLRSVDGRAVWIWRHDKVPRLDRQDGVNCTIFRNEGDWLSSDLVREADRIAWEHWPTERRHFTYVGDSDIRSTNPGYCFKMAGWRHAGRNKDGRLTVLEMYPDWQRT